MPVDPVAPAVPTSAAPSVGTMPSAAAFLATQPVAAPTQSPAAPVAEAPPVGVVTPAPVAAPPQPTDAFIPVPKHLLDDYHQSKAKLATIEAEQRRVADELSKQQAFALAQKGEFENALKMREAEAQKAIEAERQRLAESESRSKSYALDGELSRALASAPLVEGAAAQLTKLWRDEFGVSVDPSTNQITVRTADFRSPAQFVQAMLATPSYNHFLRPSTTGGIGAPGANQSIPTPPSPQQAATPDPKNLGEDIVRWINARATQSADGRLMGGSVLVADELGRPKAVPQQAAAFGLRRQA